MLIWIFSDKQMSLSKTIPACEDVTGSLLHCSQRAMSRSLQESKLNDGVAGRVQLLSHTHSIINKENIVMRGVVLLCRTPD